MSVRWVIVVFSLSLTVKIKLCQLKSTMRNLVGFASQITTYYLSWLTVYCRSASRASLLQYCNFMLVIYIVNSHRLHGKDFARWSLCSESHHQMAWEVHVSGLVPPAAAWRSWSGLPIPAHALLPLPATIGIDVEITFYG